MGYGSGKLFRIIKNRENNQEKSNFKKDLINPLTGKIIDKYYLNNETFEEKLSSYSIVIDECRALLMGLFFCGNESIRDIFYVNKSDYRNVTFTIWLLFFIRGMQSVKMYIEKEKEWVHQYSQSAYIFTKYILENQKEGEEIIKFEINEENDTFKILLNKEMILLASNNLLSNALLKLHIWKCTEDVENAKEFIDNYSKFDDSLLKIKKIVDKVDEHFNLLLFHNLVRDEKDDTVIYKEYDKNLEGIIENNLNRFGLDYNKDIYNQWIKYATNFIKT